MGTQVLTTWFNFCLNNIVLFHCWRDIIKSYEEGIYVILFYYRCHAIDCMEAEYSMHPLALCNSRVMFSTFSFIDIKAMLCMSLLPSVYYK